MKSVRGFHPAGILTKQSVNFALGKFVSQILSHDAFPLGKTVS